MANIYASVGMGDKAKNTEAMRIKTRSWKKPGCSKWVGSSDNNHEFFVKNTNHEQGKYINLKLKIMIIKARLRE